MIWSRTRGGNEWLTHYANAVNHGVRPRYSRLRYSVYNLVTSLHQTRLWLTWLRIKEIFKVQLPVGLAAMFVADKLFVIHWHRGT